MINLGEEDKQKSQLFYLFSLGYSIGYRRGQKSVVMTERGMEMNVPDGSSLGKMANDEFDKIYELNKTQLLKIFNQLGLNKED